MNQFRCDYCNKKIKNNIPSVIVIDDDGKIWTFCSWTDLEMFVEEQKT